MQTKILAVFDTVSHAQAAIDDLLGCDIPAAAIHQFCIPKGVDPLDAIKPQNAFHRPKGTFTWVMDDPPPANVTGEIEVLHYEEGRLAHERAVIVVECAPTDQTRIEEVLHDHTTLEVGIVSIDLPARKKFD